MVGVLNLKASKSPPLTVTLDLGLVDIIQLDHTSQDDGGSGKRRTVSPSSLGKSRKLMVLIATSSPPTQSFKNIL